MTTTIVWKGIFYNSLEYFKLTEMEDDILAESKIIGTCGNKTYLVEYNIEMDTGWRVSRFEIAYEVNNSIRKITGEKISRDRKINGLINPSFSGFHFIDITLTPFTNTLPIRNLHLDAGETAKINVIYLDILENSIQPLTQQYQKNTHTHYHYENIPTDFESGINVDEWGLVTSYPALFERAAHHRGERH